MSNETEQAVERVTDDLRLFDGNSGVSLCRASAVSLGADLRLILTALAHSEARERRKDAALTLALDYLGEMEPGDSRAVSNEYVAMAGVLCDIEPNRPGEEIEIILNALRARKNPNADDLAAALTNKTEE